MFVFGSRLPTYFGGKIVWLPKQNWTSFYHRHEDYMVDAIRRDLHAGGVFLDVGANVGWFTLFASTIAGPKGRVVAFEPAPDVFKILSENVDPVKNVEAFPFGIGNADTTATFAAQGVSSSASFIEEVTNINKHFLPETPVTGVAVLIRRLDTLVAELDLRPDLIKIDVEGFELEALKGAAQLLATRRPTLIVEVHPPQLRMSAGTEAELFELLGTNGYGWQVINRNPNSLYTIVARPE